ncbi:MAG: glycosyl transferase, partial [Phycisphaerae bacterium]
MAKRQTHNKSLPFPSLEHLQRLTDDTGLLQHARYIIPYREEGYCTDDNARAVIVASKHYAQYHDQETLQLLNRYLAFVLHSQNSDGSVKNLMNFDRTWRKNDPGNDALGRVLWALGTVLAKPPSPAHLPIIKEYFENSVACVKKQSPRGLAYSILGISEYLKQFPQAGNLKGWMKIAADNLAAQYKKNDFPDWQWFDDALTYDNAVMPHALF